MISPGQQPRDHNIIATDKTNRKCPQDRPKAGWGEEDGSKRNKRPRTLNEIRTTIKENRSDFPCVCGRIFNSLKGLKIHRTKMGCASHLAIQKQRSVNADKTSENQSQEANHSAGDIQAVGLKDETQPELPRIKFPPACESEACSMLDYAIRKALDKKLGKKKYNQRLVLNEVCKNIFGVKETINKPPAKENSHQRMMKDIRNKKKNLKRHFHLAILMKTGFVQDLAKPQRKIQRSQKGGKPEKETSETKERARAFLPRTIQISKEHI